ncbi:hypothetical protein ACFC58_02925 [Kitasatospora purpeofusca]|uniref:hypothetical protein n=1 Tax=Kitasatospora purpeofusca TaxID=67352 RepID=UPI0035DADDA5
MSSSTTRVVLRSSAAQKGNRHLGVEADQLVGEDVVAILGRPKGNRHVRWSPNRPGRMLLRSSAAAKGDRHCGCDVTDL